MAEFAVAEFDDKIPPPREGLDPALVHYGNQEETWKHCRMAKPFEVDGITYVARGNSVLIQPMIGLKYGAERREPGPLWDGSARMICSRRWCEDCWLDLCTMSYWPCGRKGHRDPEPVPTYI